MSAALVGILDWGMTQDEEGHRNYKLKSLVKATSFSDGPYTVGQASGLSAVGSYWVIGNDNDQWAFCHPEASFQRWQAIDGEVNYWWVVEQLFSTRPIWRCQDFTIQNPALEPPKISGSFIRDSQITFKDADGNLIKSSSYEPIPVLKPSARPTVIIEQNQLMLGLDIFSPMVNTLNDSPMWNLGTRTVMLTNVSWNRVLFGTCNFYYTLRMEFEVNTNGWDYTDIIDQGYRAYKGTGPKTNPKNYTAIIDSNGKPVATPRLLDGAGNVSTSSTPSYLPTVKATGQNNFFLLGIPFSLA